ncbi:MAG TPA: glycosyltransferase family 4 protein, partial [Cyclobacteriaceae bacterium]
MKVLFFVRRVGPYHHARFDKAAKRLQLVVVETRPLSQEYPWEFAATGEYLSETLPEGDPERGIRGHRLHDSVRNLFIKHHPSVIVTTGWADPEYHAAVLEARSRNIPCVVISDSRHEDEPRKFHKEAVKRVILRSYSAALVAGSASRRYLVKLGFPSPAIFQPWDVVDNSFFATANSDETVPFSEKPFLCISRFIPKKNLPRLISAYGSYVRRGGTRKLILLGSGELERSLIEQIKELELDERVEVKGFVQYENLPAYFSSALCLILPSTTDQWGLVVNEAMASELPVLVSQNCGCAVDLVRDKENGCIFDPFRVDDIADKMLFMSGISEAEW